jgi:DNA-binding HxlR family transcriptional regulator
MYEDLKEEMKKLKEEIAGLKDQLKDVAGRRSGGRQGMYIDFGNMQEYVDDVMRGVAEGVHGELEKSIFIGPRGCRMWAGQRHEGEEREEREEVKVDFNQAAKAMSALGQEHRLRILDVLVRGGKYINELQEELKDITTSTLSSHLGVLEEAGMVVQEKVRGRYLITMPGRTAYQMARRVSRFLGAGGEE